MAVYAVPLLNRLWGELKKMETFDPLASFVMSEFKACFDLKTMKTYMMAAFMNPATLVRQMWCPIWLDHQ